ncbi:MAG: GntR family transcriptional regulator [Spirochaeta sp.]
MTRNLRFSIDHKSGVPYYKQIILQIELAIADNRLSTGDQLPTVRGLAVDLKVNPNTIAKAYSQLELRGIVNTQQGTGTFISDREITLTDIERERVLTEICQTALSQAGSYGFTADDIIDQLTELSVKN